MWRDPNLLAREGSPATDFGPVEAQRFSETLARRLGVDPEYINAAFEDPMYYLQRERNLPVNVDPLENHLEDERERERVRQVFARGLNTPTGYVLPLQRGVGKNGPEWQTGLWMLRGQHLFLVPGDSPVGLRLPLPSLPWVATRRHSGESRGRSAGEARAAPGAAADVAGRPGPPARARSPSGKAIGSRSLGESAPGSSARLCASNRAMDGCTSSCRRRERSKTTSSC